MSRAPRRPDGWGGSDDGSHRALRLVEAPEVCPVGARLFPFRGALAISAVLVFLLWWMGVWLWPLSGFLIASESRPVMVLRYLEEEPKPVRVVRQAGALPPHPASHLPVRIPMEHPPFPRGAEVVQSGRPLVAGENWEEVPQTW